MLAPHIDRLFDKGYITFSQDGSLLISQELPHSVLQAWSLTAVAPKKPLSRKSQNNILIPLRGVFRLISKILPGFKDPTDGVENMKAQAPAPDPFTLEEVELILAALRRISVEVADFYEFAFLRACATASRSHCCGRTWTW